MKCTECNERPKSTQPSLVFCPQSTKVHCMPAVADMMSCVGLETICKIGKSPSQELQNESAVGINT
eukprot:5636290-Amphidinium_carterae.1